MARYKASKIPRKTLRKMQIVKAVCSFPDGDSRRLFITSLSLGGAFILSLKPPHLGTNLSITLRPDQSPLPAIDARVIGLRIDPANIDRCGFEVVFIELKDAVLAELASLIGQLEQNSTRRREERLCQAPDRRENPRVSTRLEAVIHLPQQSYQAKVADLSIGGALLQLGQKATSINQGDELQVSVVAPNAPEHLALRARAVRLIEGKEPQEIGVAFIDLNEIVQRRLEGLILDSLTEEYESLT